MIVACSLRRLFKSSLLAHRFSDAKPPVFEELLASNDPKSLEQATTILASLQNENKGLSSILDKIRQESKLIKANEGTLATKLERLQGNIRDQQEENQLVVKRCKKELENAQMYSITKVVKELLDVADNMKRCNVECDKKFGDKKDAFLNKLKQANDVLVGSFKKFGVSEFDPAGQKYDPNTSESMVEVPDPSKEDGTVAMTTQTGYMIKDRVLRSAKVCVYRN